MITIVGGGLSGLATALAIRDLAKERGEAPPRLRVLEAAEQPGGKIRTIHASGFTCEWGPNGFLDREPKTKELCHRLGLDSELQPAADAFKKRYLYRGGRLHEVSMNPVRFLASSLLPWRAKFRLALEPFLSKPETAEEDETVASFARRRIGEDAYRILIDSMQSGIYAGDPERMSVQSCFPRVVEIERQYGSLIRGMVKLMIERRSAKTAGGGPTGHLTSLKTGIQPLIDALARELGDEVVQCGVRVERVQPRTMAPGYLLDTDDGRRFAADLLILACPADTAARLLQPLDQRLGELLAGVEYAPLVVVSMGFQREQIAHPLDGFGFLAPRGQGLRMLGSLFSSSIFPGRAPEGHALLRIMIGGARDHEILDLSEGEIAELVLGEVAPLLGISGAPSLTRVFRHERAIPQYNVGHGRRVAEAEQRAAKLGSLLLGGNAYRGIGINDCVKNARPLAEQALADWHRHQPAP